MPYLRIETNVAADKEAREALLQEASQMVSQQLGKPEQWVMATLQPGVELIFAGDMRPAAYLELRAIGLPRKKTSVLSKCLCDLMRRKFEIPIDRVYVTYVDSEWDMWGWNGKTFG